MASLEIGKFAQIFFFVVPEQPTNKQQLCHFALIVTTVKFQEFQWRLHQTVRVQLSE